MENTLSQENATLKVILAALIGNFLVAVTKFIAATLTGSSAMFSEAIHSVVDTSNQVLLLWGIKASKKPADKDFPFGHGKEVYFWNFIVAIMIFAVGAVMSIYEGVHHIMHPEPIANAYINYIVLCIALVFEGCVFFFALREFKKSKGDLGYFNAVQRSKDPSMFVVLFEDSAAMLGLMIALIGVALTEYTGMLWIDGLASVLIGLVLAFTALWLAVETKGLLIGEAAEPEVVTDIHSLVGDYAGIEKINEVLTMHMGPDYILVNLSVDVVNNLRAGDLETAIAQLDRQIKERHPRVKRVFIEAEAAPAVKAAGDTPKAKPS